MSSKPVGARSSAPGTRSRGRAAARPYLLLFLAAACSTGGGGPVANIPKPKVQVIQRTNIAESIPTVPTGIAVHYEVRITNQAQVPITLKRIDLDAMEGGGFDLEAKTRIYNVTIAPGDTGSVDFVTTAYIDPRRYESRMPVAIRAQTLFDTPEGKLTAIVQQRVSATSGD